MHTQHTYPLSRTNQVYTGAALGARYLAWQARAVRCMWSCVSVCRREWLRFPVAWSRAGGARSSMPCGRPGGALAHMLL